MDVFVVCVLALLALLLGGGTVVLLKRQAGRAAAVQPKAGKAAASPEAKQHNPTASSSGLRSRKGKGRGSASAQKEEAEPSTARAAVSLAKAADGARESTLATNSTLAVDESSPKEGSGTLQKVECEGEAPKDIGGELEQVIEPKAESSPGDQAEGHAKESVGEVSTEALLDTKTARGDARQQVDGSSAAEDAQALDMPGQQRQPLVDAKDRGTGTPEPPSLDGSAETCEGAAKGDRDADRFEERAIAKEAIGIALLDHQPGQQPEPPACAEELVNLSESFAKDEHEDPGKAMPTAEDGHDAGQVEEGDIAGEGKEDEKIQKDAAVEEPSAEVTAEEAQSSHSAALRVSSLYEASSVDQDQSVHDGEDFSAEKKLRDEDAGVCATEPVLSTTEEEDPTVATKEVEVKDASAPVIPESPLVGEASAMAESDSSSELVTESGSSDREEKSGKAEKHRKHRKKDKSKSKKEKKEKKGDNDKAVKKERKHKHKHKHHHKDLELHPEDTEPRQRARSSSSARNGASKQAAEDGAEERFERKSRSIAHGELEETKKRKKDKEKSKKKRLSSITSDGEKSPTTSRKHRHKHKHKEKTADDTRGSDAPQGTPASPEQIESPTKRSKRISLIGKNLIKKKLGRLSSLTGKQAQHDIRAMQESSTKPSSAEAAPPPVAEARVETVDIADPPVVMEAVEPPVYDLDQKKEELATQCEEDTKMAAELVPLADAKVVSESLAELMEAACGATLSYSNLPEVTEDMLGFTVTKPQASPPPAASLSEIFGNTGLPPIPTKAKQPIEGEDVAKELPADDVEDQDEGHTDKQMLFEPLYNCWDDVVTSNPTAEWVTVMDNGTFAIKGGNCDHLSPSVVVPPISARPRAGSRTSMLGPNEAVVYGKEAVMAIERHLEQATPFRDGVISEWDDMQTLWERAFRSINVDLNSTGHSLLLTAPSSTDFAKLGEVAFEYFGVPSLNVVSQEQAALASARHWSGVSINLGASTSTVTPILYGCEVKHAIRKFAVTGRVLTAFVSTLLPWESTSQQHGSISERNRERLACYVKETEISVALPDGSCPSEEGRLKNEIDVEGPLDTRFASTLVPKDCTAGAEILFTPEAACGPGSVGLPALVVEAVMACDAEARLPLLDNILLSGGSSQFPGLCARLQHEIRKQLPEALRGAAVKVSRAMHPQLAAYNGCRNLAHAPFYPLQCATIDAYHEAGAASVVRRFG